MRNKILLISLALILVIVPLFAACAPKEEAPAPAPAAPPAPAPKPEPIHLKWMTFLGKDDASSIPTVWFVERVQEQSKGEIIFDYVGGSEAIAGFDQANAAAAGVIDITFTPTSYYAEQLPGANAVMVSELTPWEEREVGFDDIFQELHNKINLRYLGRGGKGIYMYIFVTKPIEEPKDLVGAKLRASATVAEFWKRLGATSVSVAYPEIYTASEQGVIDGFSWSWRGIHAKGWTEVLYGVIFHPLFYGNGVLVMNLDKWNALPKHLQEIIIKVMNDLQWDTEAWIEEEYDKEMERWKDAGMEFIEFSPADAKWLVNTAHDSVWEPIIAESPELGQKLKKLLTR